MNRKPISETLCTEFNEFETHQNIDCAVRTRESFIFCTVTVVSPVSALTRMSCLSSALWWNKCTEVCFIFPLRCAFDEISVAWRVETQGFTTCNCSHSDTKEIADGKSM